MQMHGVCSRAESSTIQKQSTTTMVSAFAFIIQAIEMGVHIAAGLLGGSVKQVCTSECPLQSFAQEVVRGCSVTSGLISE